MTIFVGTLSEVSRPFARLRETTDLPGLNPYNYALLFRGATHELALEVMLADRSKPLDLTHWDIFLTVKQDLTDERPVFQRSSKEDGGIVVDANPRLGKATVTIEPANTQRLEPGSYIFDVWLFTKDTGEQRIPIVTKGVFEVAPGATHKPL